MSCNCCSTNVKKSTYNCAVNCGCKCACPCECDYPVKNVSCVYSCCSKLKTPTPKVCPEPIQKKKCVYGCQYVLKARCYTTGCVPPKNEKKQCCSYGTTGHANLKVCSTGKFPKKYSRVCPTDYVCCSTVLPEKISCDKCKNLPDDNPVNCPDVGNIILT